MEINGLTKRQMADLGSLIGSAGYAPSEFHEETGRISVSGDPSTPALIHASGAWFGFGRHYRASAYSDTLTDEGFSVAFAPGGASPSEERGPLKWQGVAVAFKDWLRYIREELSAPDFDSAALHAATLNALPAESADDLPFSLAERDEIAERLIRLEEELVKQGAARAADAAEVQRGFADLRDELTRMRRGRWKTFVLGTVMQLAGKRAISSEVAKNALEAIGDVIQNWAHRLPHP